MPGNDSGSYSWKPPAQAGLINDLYADAARKESAGDGAGFTTALTRALVAKHNFTVQAASTKECKRPFTSLTKEEDEALHLTYLLDVPARSGGGGMVTKQIGALKSDDVAKMFNMDAKALRLHFERYHK